MLRLKLPNTIISYISSANQMASATPNIDEVVDNIADIIFKCNLSGCYDLLTKKYDENVRRSMSMVDYERLLNHLLPRLYGGISDLKRKILELEYQIKVLETKSRR